MGERLQPYLRERLPASCVTQRCKRRVKENGRGMLTQRRRDRREEDGRGKLTRRRRDRRAEDGRTRLTIDLSELQHSTFPVRHSIFFPARGWTPRSPTRCRRHHADPGPAICVLSPSVVSLSHAYSDASSSLRSLRLCVSSFRSHHTAHMVRQPHTLTSHLRHPKAL